MSHKQLLDFSLSIARLAERVRKLEVRRNRWNTSSSGHIIQDESVDLVARARLNFLGAGVTATDNPITLVTDVTIPGAAPTTYYGADLYSMAGVISIATGGLRVYNRFPYTIFLTEAFLSVAVAPVGADIVVDILKNGITIFGGPWPTILDGANAGSLAIPNIPVLTGDYLTVDVLQVGAAVTGADLTIQYLYTH